MQAELNLARGITDSDLPSRADASNDWRGDRTQQVMRGPANPGQADSVSSWRLFSTWQATDWRRDNKPAMGGGGPPSNERQAMLAKARDFTSGPGGGGVYRPPMGNNAATPGKVVYVPPSQRAQQQQPGGDRPQQGNRPASTLPPAVALSFVAEAPSGNWR